jgi:cytochrome c oxidase assembly protein subunit 15
MGSVLAILHHPATLRRLAFASVIVNVIIVVTGGLVRLTDSGLGCPTWPRCTDDSYVPTSAMGIHGAIEFGNRTLISVVGGVAVAGLIVAWLQRDRLRAALWPAFLVLVGVAVQGVVGGITVHLALNPYSVALHFLLSIVMLALAHTFWTRTREGRPRWTPPPALRALALCLTVVSAAVLVLGTVVTGSGPHAGDAKAARTGFDPQAMAQLHADGVFLLIGLSVALWFAARALGAPHRVVRAVLVLVVVELSQGVVGFVQYFTGLPVAVVAAHMLGACLVWLATLSVLAAVSGVWPPLAGEKPEEQVVRPLAFDPRTGDQVSLAAEADALEQPRGADVAPIGARREPV